MTKPKANYLKVLIQIIKARLDGRTGSWLAKNSGLSQSKVSRVLNEVSEPDITGFIGIATALKLTPAYLIDLVILGQKSQIDDEAWESAFGNQIISNPTPNASTPASYPPKQEVLVEKVDVTAEESRLLARFRSCSPVSRQIILAAAFKLSASDNVEARSVSRRRQ